MISFALLKSNKIIFLLAVILSVIITAAALVIVSRTARKPASTAGENKDREIFAISNGVHIDLVVPKSDFLSFSSLNWSFSEASDQSKTHMDFGWGDANFFFYHDTWATITFNDILQAAFYSHGSAMRVSFLDASEVRGATRIELSSANLKPFVGAIDSSFISQNSLKIVRRRETPTSALFFASNGKYSLFNNCNDWTATMLRSANIPTPMFVTNAYSIMRILKLNSVR
ncbi:MAG: hypothetical protein RJB13_321 [Pseudomonadota bacterium]